MTRYILEGEWTGYTSGQRKIVHREILDDRKSGKGFIEKCKQLRCIVYTDGTSLLLSLREAKPREQVQERHGYTSLIREAAALNKSRVLVEDLK